MRSIFSTYEERKAAIEKRTHPLAKGVAWIAGSLVPLDDATIPLKEQSFLHGDLTYDVPAVWEGRFFRLDDRISRLSSSCANIRLSLPLPATEITRI